MRVLFFVKTAQLLVALCMALLLSKSIELCNEGAFDKFLLDENDACHHAAVHLMWTLYSPFDVDDYGATAADVSSPFPDDVEPADNDTRRVVATDDQNVSYPHTASLKERESKVTNRVCWTLDFEERFRRPPKDARLDLTGLLVALFAVAIIIVALLIQLATVALLPAPPTRRPETLRSLLLALLWSMAAVSMIILRTNWSNGWQKKHLQPTFPNEWLVALILGWTLTVESILEAFCGDALHIKVSFERLAGRYDVFVENSERRQAEKGRRF